MGHVRIPFMNQSLIISAAVVVFLLPNAHGDDWASFLSRRSAPTNSASERLVFDLSDDIDSASPFSAMSVRLPFVDEPCSTVTDVDHSHGRTDSAVDQFMVTEGSFADRLSVVSTRRAEDYCGECCPEPRWYASLTADASRLFGSTFGVNLADEVPSGIQGSASDNGYTLGGAIGRYIPICICDRPMNLRAELQALDRHDFSFTTGPAGIPASQYLTNIGDVWTATANLWLDVPITENFGGFAGFGLGGAGYDIAVANLIPPANFLAVRGSGSSTHFTYMVGAGAYYRIRQRITLDVGWRYVDLGDTTIGLVTANGGFPAGTYQTDLESHELLINLRLDLF